jgi:hypothetical protein
MVARLAPVALQPWKPPGVYQRSTAAVFPPPAAAGTFTIGTLQIFLSPQFPFFIETFFDKRKYIALQQKKSIPTQNIIKNAHIQQRERKKKLVKVMSDSKRHETTTTNDNTQTSPRYYFV